MASKQIIETNQACVLKLRFWFKQPDKTTAIDVTGATGNFSLKRECSASDADALFLTTSIIIPEGTDGKCYVKIPASNMSALAITDYWELFAQLKLALPDGDSISSKVFITRIFEDN